MNFAFTRRTERQLCLVLVLIALSQMWATSSIYLSSPNNGASFLLPRGSLSLSVPLQFQLFSLPPGEQEHEFCFEVLSVDTGMTPFVPQTCFPVKYNSLTVNDIKSGQYSLNAWLKAVNSGTILEETRITNAFTVHSYESALPRLEIATPSAGPVTVIAARENKGDLRLRFAYSPSLLDHALFATCVSLANTRSGAVELPLTCLNANDRELALSNLNIGEYEMHFFLQDVRNRESVLKETEVVRVVRVVPLEEALPALRLVEPLQEYAEDEKTHTAAVRIPFELTGETSTFPYFAVCLSIRERETQAVLVPRSCLSSKDNVITLQNVQRGEYSARLELARADNTAASFPSAALDFSIAIRSPVEFVPTYDWQPLHPWHTIPAGIQTRLPVGWGARKEARIPEPWRLQLTMPSPCKYFLRMDVRRQTTLAQIIEAAAKKCAAPVECFRIVVGEKEMQDPAKATVQSTNLFMEHKELKFVEGCAIHNTHSHHEHHDHHDSESDHVNI